VLWPRQGDCPRSAVRPRPARFTITRFFTEPPIDVQTFARVRDIVQSPKRSRLVPELPPRLRRREAEFDHELHSEVCHCLSGRATAASVIEHRFQPHLGPGLSRRSPRVGDLEDDLERHAVERMAHSTACLDHEAAGIGTAVSSSEDMRCAARTGKLLR
jgi:hypothetical protein